MGTAPAENTQNQRGGIIQMNAYSPWPAAAVLVQSKTSVTDD